MEQEFASHTLDLYANKPISTEWSLTFNQIGALISFIVIGIDIFFVMQSLGELATLYPTPGAFTELAGRFIDPAIAVALGWNYWYLVRKKKERQARQSSANPRVVGKQHCSRVQPRLHRPDILDRQGTVIRLDPNCMVLLPMRFFPRRHRLR